MGKCEGKGRLTCINAKGSGVVHYCLSLITEKTSLDIINEFKVRDISTNSDHSALNLRLNLKPIKSEKEHENDVVSDEDSIGSNVNQAIKEICESYNWRYVPENDRMQEKVKKCLDS